MKDYKWKNRWNEIKEKVANNYSDLTDDDLAYIEGQEEELLTRLVTKTGKSRDEVNNWLNTL